jgi:hypothetical protein
MNRCSLFIAAFCAAITGCASVDQQARQGAATQDDKDYVTGSRIPVKTGTTSSTVKTTSDRAEIDKMMTPNDRRAAAGGPLEKPQTA